MPISADTMIASLGAFVAKDDGRDEETLDKIVDDFGRVTDPLRVLPAIFAVMERHPHADLGSPGPLVHSIETLPIPEFEPFLRKSVGRQPGQLNVWMVNRILNGRLPAHHRQELLTLLDAVRSNPRASRTTREMAERFLQRQAERDA